MRGHSVGMSTRPLPPELGSSFSVAQALRAGVGRSRLRAGSATRVFHGARTTVRPDQAGESGLWREREARLRWAVEAYRPIMPRGAFFAARTAARLWDIPLPPWMGDDTTLDVGVHHPRTAPQRPGVRGIQVRPRMAGVVDVDGIPVTDPASTWAMLGGSLELYDLTAAADRLLRVPRHPGGFQRAAGSALATRGELESALSAGRRRGAELLRTALARSITGSSSRPETWVRLILVDAGLPEPVADHDVHDDLGRFIGCEDLAYPDRRVAIEYEGGQHASARQMARDIDKYHALEASGWRVIRVTADHVFRVPGEAVRRVRAALAAAPR